MREEADLRHEGGLVRAAAELLLDQVRRFADERSMHLQALVWVHVLNSCRLFQLGKRGETACVRRDEGWHLSLTFWPQAPGTEDRTGWSVIAEPVRKELDGIRGQYRCESGSRKLPARH